jgi:uncharacterized protein YqjF (DUF2071 family)
MADERFTATASPLGPRPYPPPHLPWAMKQVWRDLLFAHWPIDPAVVRPLVPAPFPLDTFDGRAWIGVVPFRITGLRPRAAPPMPFVSSFPELNVRTYVTLDGKPGVYFFSLDAGSRLAVEAARLFYRLPYAKARITVARRGEAVDYTSVRTDRRFRPAELRARYRPMGPVVFARPGSLDHWLTARYCLVDPAGDLHAQPEAGGESPAAEEAACGARPPDDGPSVHRGAAGQGPPRNR